MKPFVFLCLLAFTPAMQAQNLVPNPSFENMDVYTGIIKLNCVSGWRNYSGFANPDMRTPDLCFLNNPGSFPPMSINPYDGSQYVAIDCEVHNPEYLQVKLSSPMVAGATYCVSYFISAYEQQFNPFSYLGVYFSPQPLIVNPYVDGLSSQITSSVIVDPTVWQQVSDTYIAAGGEEFITIGGFQNTMPLYTYVYIDMVDVHRIDPVLNLAGEQQICKDEEVILDAGNDGSAYLWSTGETTSAITVNTPGIYSVEKFYGACSFFQQVVVSSNGCNEPWTAPEPTLFIPAAFTPNGDGLNDDFGAVGTNISEYEIHIFDRWGEEVFTSVDLQKKWNGKYHENHLPGGIYVYQVNYKKDSGIIHTTGHVMLLR
jgi:gliding motility-associated-like protein